VVRRLVFLLAVMATMAALVAPAIAHRPSGIEGAVVNTTCPGPCIYPPPPAPLYAGDGLTVEFRRLKDDVLVAVRHPTNGHFRARLKRGRYDVSASVAGGRCWQGDTAQVKVRRHHFSHVDLSVQNTCVV